MTSVEVVTAWWNESMLAPLFLRHYWYADSIKVLLDKDSSPEFIEQINEYKANSPNLHIIPVEYPEGIDWSVKSRLVREVAGSSTCDWVYMVDADEFIFPGAQRVAPWDWLAAAKGNVIRAPLFTVYRHENDLDLDLSRPPIPQRVYGNPQAGASYGEQNPNQYRKPCVVRPEMVRFTTDGVHSYHKGSSDVVEFEEENFCGAHWCMADPKLAVQRRLGQKSRQSPHNLLTQTGLQNHFITAKEIEKECLAHLNDPFIPQLAVWSEAGYCQEFPLRSS